jgi:hypothetical protein
MICPNCKLDIKALTEIDIEPMSEEEKAKRPGWLVCCGNCAHLYFLELSDQSLHPFQPSMLEGVPEEAVRQIREFQRNIFINSRREQAARN